MSHPPVTDYLAALTPEERFEIAEANELADYEALITLIADLDANPDTKLTADLVAHCESKVANYAAEISKLLAELAAL